MRKGMSLVEVMVACALGISILGGLMQFSGKMVAQYGRETRRQKVRGHMRMAHEELLHIKQGLEPSLFDLYPPQRFPKHEIDHHHGAMSWTKSCPDGSKGACVLVWDVVPSQPEIYEVTRVNDDWFSIVQTNGKTISKDIGAMSLCLLSPRDDEKDYLMVLLDRDVSYVQYQAASGQQVWPLPEQFEGAKLLHLGRLKVQHVDRKDDSDWIGFLRYRPYELSANGWIGKRSHSSYAHLYEMVWSPCGSLGPDRLMLLGREARPPRLTQPIYLNERRFVKEVHNVSLPF